jgi:hypothetical protein
VGYDDHSDQQLFCRSKSTVSPATKAAVNCASAACPLGVSEASHRIELPLQPEGPTAGPLILTQHAVPAFPLTMLHPMLVMVTYPVEML